MLMVKLITCFCQFIGKNTRSGSPDPQELDLSFDSTDSSTKVNKNKMKQ